MRRTPLLLLCLFFCGLIYGQNITPAGPTGFCPGGFVTLTINAPVGGSTYKWFRNGTQVAGSAVTYNANIAGTYTAIVSLTGSPDTTLNDVVVIAYSQPVADFNFTNNNTCSGTAIPFTSSVSVGTAPFTYAWDFGDGSPIDVTQNPSHAFTSLGCGTGTFNVKLTVTDANGCKSVVITKPVSVKQAPDVRLGDQNNAFNPFKNCDNNPTPSNPNYTLTVTNISVGTACITSYTVDWGDGFIVTNPVFPLIHTYTQLGEFNLSLTGTGTNGCTYTKTYIVANQSNPDIGIGTIGPTIGCASLSINAVVSLWTGNSPGTKYRLEFGDGTILNLTHPINSGLTNDTIPHIYNSSSCPGSPTYQLRITATNGCKSKSFIGGDIEVRSKPQPQFSLPRPIYCVNTSVCFTNETIPGYYANCGTTTNYLWDFGDGTPTNTLQNPCHTYTTPGVYTVSLTTSNPCGNGTTTRQVCVTGLPTSSFSLNKTEGCAPQAITATNNSVIGESCAAGTYLWRITYSPTNCGTVGNGNYFTGGTNATSTNPSFSFTNPGTYTITLDVTNTCGTVSSSKTVVIKNPPKATLPTIPNTCSSVTVNPSTGAAITNCAGGTLTYLWTFPGGATSTNADPGSITFNTVGTNTITLAVTNECGTITATTSFVIAPPPTLTVPLNDTVCAGEVTGPYTSSSTTTGTTFSWTNNNTSIGLGASGSGATIPSFTAINSGTATITVRATQGGCPITQTFTITVNPRPAKPTIVRPVIYCLNEIAIPLSATASGTNTINWYTVYPLSGGTTTPPIPSTTVAGSTTYYVTQTDGTCESDTARIVVTINPKIANNTIAADQTICNGSTANALTPQLAIGGGNGVYQYQWQQSTDGGATWTNIAGATSNNYNPGAITADTKYRRVAVSNTCSDTSNIITILVQGSLTNVSIGINQTICQGGQPDTLRGQLPIGGNGIFSYQWESSPDNTNWTNIAGATQINYYPPTLTTTTYYKRKVTSGQCAVTSVSIQITVNPRPTMIVIADKIFCNNASSGSINFASTPPATSYAWINDNANVGLATSGTGNISLFTAANNSNPKIPITATIKVAGTFTANSVSCVGDTASFKIIVLPTVNIAAIPDTNVCTGQTIGIYTPVVTDTAAFAGVNIQYSWVVSGTAISLTNGSGSQIPAYTSFNPNTTDLISTVTVTPKYTYLGKTCDGISRTFTVTVKPATANANAGANQTLCAQITATLSATAVSGTTGVWTLLSGTATITSPISNITTVTSLVPGTVYQFVWTQTGFASCLATKDTVVIDNKLSLVNKIDTSTKTICAGVILNITGQVPTGGGGIYTYQWESSTDGINYTAIAGSTSQSATITPTQTTWLRRFVNTPPCSGYSDTLKINVQPAITNNNINANQTICTGIVAQTITGSSPSGGNNVFIYEWQQSINGGATWTTITGSTGINYSPGALTQTIHYRRIVSTTLCNGSFGSTSNVVIITVNPDARALFIPTDTIKCPPFVITPAIMNLQTFAANNQYLWYANNVLIGTGTIFPGYAITNENDSVIIKLVTISSVGCKNDSLARKFKTVKKPTPSFTASDTVGCGPLTVTFTNTSSYINEYTYFWNFGNGQTSTAIQPGAITFTPNPNYGDTTYIVKLQVFSPCDTLTFTRNIRVKSKPKALFTPVRTSGCSPMVAVFRNNSKGVNNTYYWDFGDGTTVSTTSTDSIQHTYITGVVDTFYVKLKAVNECGEDSITYSVIVAPNTIRLNVAVNGTDLFGCQPHPVPFVNNSQGASLFSWNFGDGATTTTTKNIDTVRHTYLTSGTYIVTIRAINNCSDTTTTMSITVYAKPKARFTADKFNICRGDSVRFVNQSDSATAYQWQFGDGGTSTLSNPFHIYSTPGTYTVRLVAYRDNASGNSCTDTTVQTITVTSTQSGLFTVSDSVGNCAPFTVTLVNKNRPSVTTVWDLGDGTTANGDSIVHTYQIAGTYIVRLATTVPGGCTYITNKTIIVNGPTGTLQYNGGFVCSPSAVQFHAVATNATNYIFDFGDGQTLSTTQQVVFHSYVNPGFYLPKVTLQNGACNVVLQGIDTIKVDKVNGGFRFAKTELCGNTTLTFTDTSHVFSGIQNIRWNFGDNTTGTGSSPSHSYAATGRYTIQMIVLSNSGCADTVSQQIDVLVKSIPIVSINTVDTACTRRTIAFNALVQTVDAINFIQWDISNGASGTGAVFNHTFTQPGVYDVRLVVGTVNGCYDTARHTIVINPSPAVSATPSLNLCRGNTVQLNAIGAVTWQWLPLSGLSCYTCPSPIASPTITTPYVIEGKNSFGCADYDTVVITVIQPLQMNVLPNDSICIGESTNLLASGASSYNWSPPIGLSNTTISNPTASPTVTTTYRVVGYDGYNCFTDTAFITVGVGQYPTVNLGPDVTLATGTLHPLTSVITNGPIQNWLWLPTTNLSCANCPRPIAEVKKDITYAVVVTTPYGCSASDTVSIKTFCKDGQVFIPNAFTPDGDGINDKLMVRASGIVMVKYFRIFNRWGDLIFERDNFRPNDQQYGWDGKVRGVVSGPEVFVYTCEVLCENGSSFTYKGNVSIIK
jgi:gliding motility-associated-like protein